MFEDTGEGERDKNDIWRWMTLLPLTRGLFLIAVCFLFDLDCIFFLRESLISRRKFKGRKKKKENPRFAWDADDISHSRKNEKTKIKQSKRVKDNRKKERRQKETMALMGINTTTKVKEKPML